MRKALIVELAQDERACFRAVLSQSIEDGDEIVILTRELDERARAVRERIESFVGAACNARVELVEVGSFYESVSKICSRLKECYEVVAVLSSGAAAAAVTLALLLTAPKAVKVELDDAEVPAELFRLPEVLSMGEAKFRVLEAIFRGTREVKKLSRKLDLDASAVRRHIAKLEELGLVRVVKKKPMTVELSEFGRLIATARKNG